MREGASVAMPQILLVRHAQASFGAAHYDELSPLGFQQAARLDALLVDRLNGPPVRLIAGTLRRQRQTAEALPASARGVSVQSDPRWNEYDSLDVMARHGPGGVAGASDIGAAPGMSNAGFQRGLDKALEGWISAGAASPCAETWTDFQARVTAALTGLADELSAGEIALVVTSGGVVAAIVAALLRAEPHGFVALNRVTVNTAVCTILCGGSGLHVLSFGEHAHLGGDRTMITFR